MTLITHGWKGQERLWKVTWLGYLGGALILTIVAIGLYAFLNERAGWIIGPAVVLLNVWALVAMWRCAPNVDWRIWFYVARIVVIGTAVVWLLEVLGLVE